MINKIHIKASVMIRALFVILCVFYSEKTMAQEVNGSDLYNAIPQEKWDFLNSQLTEAYYLLLSEDGKRTEFIEQSEADNPICHKNIDGRNYVSVVIYNSHIGEIYWFDYRIEGKKVYRYNEKLQKDDLLMDFGLAVGDDFERPDGVKLQVIEVRDSLVEDGKTLSILNLRGQDDENVWDKWVESYGSVRTGLHLTDDIPGYQITDMLFMERRNQSFICSYAHGIYNDINKAYLRSACFDREDLKEDDECLVINRNYTIDEKGFCFDWQPKTGKLYCMLFNEKDANLKFRSIEAGDWIGTYGDSEDKICKMSMDLNLPQGSYTIIDADGVEQNITIGGDADAIDAIENDASTSKQGNGSVFDLTGRRLSTSPQRGIYIRDGRKVFK